PKAPRGRSRRFDPSSTGAPDRARELMHGIFTGEIQALEGAGRTCFDFDTGPGRDEVPFELKLDMARQCWDEARHCEISVRLAEPLNRERAGAPGEGARVPESGRQGVLGGRDAGRRGRLAHPPGPPLPRDGGLRRGRDRRDRRRRPRGPRGDGAQARPVMVTVAPATFSMVLYDRDRIAGLAADTAARVGLPDDSALHIEVDEASM